MNFSVYKYFLYGLFVASFLVSPIIGILFLVVLAFLVSNPKNFWLDIALCCSFILLVQATRTFDIHNDFVTYKSSFIRAGGMDLFAYLKTFKQPDYAWYVLNYISCYLLKGNFKLFSELIVVSTYFTLYWGLYKYWKTTDTPYSYYLTSILILTFFPTVLGVSNNLLRQQFALSIMIYSLIAHKCENVKTWPLVIFSLFCHSMTIVFAPLYFLNFDFVLKGKRLVAVVVSAMLMSFVISHISLFSVLNGIYIYERLATGASATNTDIINPSVVYSYGLIMLIFFVKSVYYDKVKTKSILYVQNLSLSLVLFCLVTSSLPMFVTRYYISRLFIIPFILPYFIMDKNWSKIYQGLIIVFFIALFFVSPPSYIDTRFFSLIHIPIWDFKLI